MPLTFPSEQILPGGTQPARQKVQALPPASNAASSAAASDSAASDASVVTASQSFIVAYFAHDCQRTVGPVWCSGRASK